MSAKHEQRRIEVVPYNTNWPIEFAEEAGKIKEALGNNCIEIHHIGSTSVPDLAAKPVIDMIPVVLDITKVENANTAMQTLGYEAKGEYGMPFRRYFQKGSNQRTHHVHVYELGNSEIDRHLKFRDWLRAHPKDKEAYARLKETLAHQHPYDINTYCLGKESFIAATDKKAGFNGLRIVKALTPREWDKVRYFRQFYFFDAAGLSDPYLWTFDHHAHAHFVLFHGSDIIGYTHLQLWPYNRAALRIIVIDEPKRSCQYGSQFLALCEKWLKSQNYSSLHVESSPAALRFYRNNGYINMPFNDPDGHKGDVRDIAVGKIL
ncbi:glutamate rich protein GrpB [Legionella busanensis]|uniref:Glutamate rich protein GrpB n=1 Tax=Legionella busanensis TaxID=190655 RepID=A0A378JK88_9GAMM|nr:GNAT family N-acetyltransferase [Legionella busanensis]STX51746.1 glutamate rich protein GrpB [Legionella busanensis]